MIKAKEIKILIIFLLVFSITSIVGCSKKNDIADTFTSNNYDYDYEIPSDIIVREILSENILLVEKENSIIEYDYKNNKYGSVLTTKADDEKFCDLKIINNNIVWSVSNEEKSYSKILMKSIKNDENINIIEDINIPIEIRLEVNESNIIYLIIDSDNYIINNFNIEDMEKSTIYKVPCRLDSETSNQVSYPSLSQESIVWSVVEYNSNSEKSKIYKYNLNNNYMEEIPNSEGVVSPVIIEDLIVGIKLSKKKYDNEEFMANYIVKYSQDEKAWNKFLDPKEYNMKFSEKNTVFALRKSNKFVYWIDSINRGYYLYDSQKDKIINIYEIEGKEDHTLIEIYMVNDNMIIYKICFDDESRNVIKKIK